MKKRLLNIATLLIILLMVLSLASCNGTDKAPNSDLNNGAGAPNKNQASSGSGASSASASESKSASESVSEPQKEEKYSEVLQYVLNNKEYNNLIKEAKDTNKSYDDIKTMLHRFEETPYGFYEDQGYNVQALKNDQLESTTVVYTKADEPNSLYVNTNIESIGATPYLTQYVLKYNLSDKEMEEFVWLHQNKYIQAQFMVDAISQTREPEILSECKITVSSQNNLLNSLRQYELTKSLLNNINLGSVSILSFDVEAGTCALMINSDRNFATMVNSGYQNVITISERTTAVETTIDGAYVGPSSYKAYYLHEDLNTSEPTSITFFNEMFNLNQTQILKI